MTKNIDIVLENPEITNPKLMIAYRILVKAAIQLIEKERKDKFNNQPVPPDRIEDGVLFVNPKYEQEFKEPYGIPVVELHSGSNIMECLADHFLGLIDEVNAHA